ncbi:DNA-binding protein [Bacillus sp. V3B]|uniref:helix-turn-helix domain-containing protein n=1 Tax=Bacillus sp. V3B TaxID=2804915 RepID=UPI00210BCD86|nr:helix-turn-helix domain-containing protein [Bacillus sp. V3B]MCQ6277410.1 DNA-binding protein [Bacillus sp. V3B]
MLEIKLDDEELKALYLAEVQKRLDKIELQSMLMDTKQLCKMLSLSWPTVEKLFLSDPNFPSIRIGKKWIFNRKQVQDYIDRWSIEKKKMRR